MFMGSFASKPKGTRSPAEEVLPGVPRRYNFQDFAGVSGVKEATYGIRVRMNAEQFYTFCEEMRTELEIFAGSAKPAVEAVPVRYKLDYDPNQELALIEVSGYSVATNDVLTNLFDSLVRRACILSGVGKPYDKLPYRPIEDRTGQLSDQIRP